MRLQGDKERMVAMAEGGTVADRDKPELPGNEGQFGEDAATERFEPLQPPAGAPPRRPAPEGPGERP